LVSFYRFKPGFLAEAPRREAEIAMDVGDGLGPQPELDTAALDIEKWKRSQKDKFREQVY
jgi:hypothetical protein